MVRTAAPAPPQFNPARYTRTVSRSHRRGSTRVRDVLLVTHDPALLLATAGRCLLIDGEVREIEPARAAAEIAGK